MTPAEMAAEYVERLENASYTLYALRDASTGTETYKAHLKGKHAGVLLALSYFREMQQLVTDGAA